MSRLPGGWSGDWPGECPGGWPGDDGDVRADDELFRYALDRAAGDSPDPYAALRVIEPRLAGHRRPGAVWLVGAAAALTFGFLATGLRADREPGVRVVTPGGPADVVTTAAAPARPGRAAIDAEGRAGIGGPGGSDRSGSAGDGSAGRDGDGSVTTSPATSPTSGDPTRRPPDASAPAGSAASGGTTDGSGGSAGGAGGPGPQPGRSGAAGTGATALSPASTRPAGDPSTSAPTVPGSQPGGGVAQSPGATAPGRSTAPGAPPAPAATLQTFTSVGGTVTVEFDGRRLRLVAVTAATGYQASTDKSSGDRVEVRFGGPRDVRVRLSVDGGAIAADIQNG